LHGFLGSTEPCVDRPPARYRFGSHRCLHTDSCANTWVPSSCSQQECFVFQWTKVHLQFI